MIITHLPQVNSQTLVFLLLSKNSLVPSRNAQRDTDETEARRLKKELEIKNLTFLLAIEQDKLTKRQCFRAKESSLSLLVWFEELSSKTASIVIVSPRIS